MRTRILVFFVKRTYLITALALCLLLVITAWFALSYGRRGGGDYWVAVVGLPEPRYAFAVSELDGKLYVMGGRHYFSEHVSVEVVTNVYRFDGEEWEEIVGLPKAMSRAGAGVLDGSLYLADGWGGQTYRFEGYRWEEVTRLQLEEDSWGYRLSQGFETVVYDNALYAVGIVQHMWPVTNVYSFNGKEWSKGFALPEHSGSAPGVYNDKLYVFGGRRGRTNDYCYDGKNWHEIARVPGKGYSTDIKVGVLDDGLYAATSAGCTSSVTPVYRFDGANWTEVAGIPMKKPSAFGVLNGVLYSIGGYDYNAPPGTGMTNVFKYVPCKK